MNGVVKPLIKSKCAQGVRAHIGKLNVVSPPVAIPTSKNRWTLTGKTKRKNGYIYDKCICSCGTVKYILRSHVLSNQSKSCGCLLRDTLVNINKTHGRTCTHEFTIWQGLRKRCENVNDKKYIDYGGRGISVCVEWKKFETFFDDMGLRPTAKHSIDRKDNDGNYCKKNCKWATKTEQARNRRVQKRNKSGVVGVYLVKDKFRAIITDNNKKHIHLGYFKTIEEATAAREEAKIKYWGENV